MLALHIFAFGWNLCGNCDDVDNDIRCVDDYEHGWIYRDSANIGMLPETMKNLYIYVSSLYFISTTATTIGYGDFGANSLLEFYYMIFVQFAGLYFFSIISGLYGTLITVPTVHEIVDAKSSDITNYLQCIDHCRTDINMDHTIYDKSIEFINKSYLYGVVSTLNYDNNFYSNMPPSIKQNLVFTLLRAYYKKFFFFFNDIEDQHFANKVFIRKVLSSLDCQIFP